MPFDTPGLIDAGPASATRGGLLPAFMNIDDRKLIELDRRLESFYKGYSAMVKSTMGNLSQGLLSITRPKSPYWTGHLRRHHFAQVMPDTEVGFALGGSGGDGSGDWMGIMAIDPDAPEHPILGGFPTDYGAKLHNYREPWFEHALNDPQFQGMLDATGSTILEFYSSKFFSPMASFDLPAGVYTGGQWIDTDSVPWSERSLF